MQVKSAWVLSLWASGPLLRGAVLIIVVRAVGFGVKRLGSAVYFLHDLAMLQLLWASISPPAKMRGPKMTRDSSTWPLHESVENNSSLASSGLPCGQEPPTPAQPTGLVIKAEANNWCFLKFFKNSGQNST